MEAVREEVLAPGQELRLVASPHWPLEVTLLEGDVMVFGCKMRAPYQLKLRDVSVALFAQNQSRVRVRGAFDSCTIANDVGWHDTVNHLYQILEKQISDVWQGWDRAAVDTRIDRSLRMPEQSVIRSQGPRVLVVGESNTGKWTLVRTLANRALADGWAPTLVDLNVGQCALSIPGSIAAVTLQRATGYCYTDVEDCLSVLAPRRYFFGDVSVHRKSEVFYNYLEMLAADVNQKLMANPFHNACGCIINTCGWIKDTGADVIHRAISLFAVDHVIVIGDKRRGCFNQDTLALIEAIQRLHRGVSVLSMRKSSGVEARSPAERQARRQAKLLDNFQGRRLVMHEDVQHRVYVETHPARDVELYVVSSDRTVQRVKQWSRQSLKGKVLAWINAPPYGSRERLNSVWVRQAPTIAFVHVMDVNILENTLTLRQPVEVIGKGYLCLVLGEVTLEEVAN